MTAKTNSWENSVQRLLFNNDNVADIGDATGLRGSSTAGSLYLGLYTSDPGEAGNQSTNEANYTGYARVAVARTSGAWTVTGGQAVNAADVSFPECTAGSNTITHVGIGVASSGSTVLLYRGALDTPLAVSATVLPRFLAGELVFEEQ